MVSKVANDSEVSSLKSSEAYEVLRQLLFSTYALDPSVFGGVAVLVTVVALAAGFLPAQRATRVHPTEVLRYE